MRYELYYWPEIQGRGEFVRLALEEAGADYLDVARLPARQGYGMPALLRVLDNGDLERPPFAPPFLKAGDRVIAQTSSILLFLGPRLGLAPRAEADRLWAHQLQLTIADFAGEIHDTHHPIASSLYYEAQKREARRRALPAGERRSDPRADRALRTVRDEHARGDRAGAERSQERDVCLAGRARLAGSVSRVTHAARTWRRPTDCKRSM